MCRGSVKCVEHLIALGAEINMPLPLDTNLTAGATPLHLAACNGHTQTVCALIAKGARADIRDSEGWTPLLVSVDLFDLKVKMCGVSPKRSCHIT